LAEAGADAVVPRITDVSEAVIDDLYRRHIRSHA